VTVFADSRSVTLLALRGHIWVLCTNPLLEQGFAWLIFLPLSGHLLMSRTGLAYSIYPDIVDQ